MSTNENYERWSAYIVTEPREPGGDSFWNRVGTVFPHKKGDGFDLVLPQGIAVSGRVTIRKDKEKEQAPRNDGYRDQ